MFSARSGACRAEPRAVSVPVSAIDEAIGRGRRDMRTPLNLQSLTEKGLVAPHADRGWGLTPRGAAGLQRDGELSAR